MSSEQAYEYFVEQLYDAMRGLVAAYAAETGDLVDMTGNLPAYHDLTTAETYAFCHIARDVIEPLIEATRAVAVVHHASTDKE